MMKRDACLKVLAKHRTNEVVVAVYTAAQEWIQISPSDLNYTLTGAMGQGSSHALGIALGRPDRRVVVLDGDGSLLMNLGSLVTIANAAPGNFVHCGCHNGNYETNGDVSIPRRGKLSFAGIAREAGYRNIFTFDDLLEWENSVPGVLGEDGPTFVDLHVEPGNPYKKDLSRLYSMEYHERFRHALAAA